MSRIFPVVPAPWPRYGRPVRPRWRRSKGEDNGSRGKQRLNKLKHSPAEAQAPVFDVLLTDAVEGTTIAIPDYGSVSV